MINQKPLVLVAHPRSRSSAFERVFIQNQQNVNTLHEPFGDAYWLGPERQLPRYEDVRDMSGFTDFTYKKVAERIAEQQHASDKRLFIKEMAFFLFPAPGNPPHIATSFGSVPAEPRNPTLLPRSELAKFHFTFLIRHPYLAVPSYYRLSLPEQRESSKVQEFNTNDLGYSELRALFEYLREEGLIRESPSANGVKATNGVQNGANHSQTVEEGDPICMIDAEDLMTHPDKIMSAYCQRIGIPYDPSILQWNSSEDQERAASVIDRWGVSVYFHKAVLSSTGLGVKAKKNIEHPYRSWVEEFGLDGANKIKEAAELQMDDYNYLSQFVFRVA
ncbi:hypothetical protein F5884DRAFT_663095 [Xylogone sp. PMI_703]|nr:hypothetical protein F5884DRAFT_663095 [Xylogone sp. PMI_703]